VAARNGAGARQRGDAGESQSEVSGKHLASSRSDDSEQWARRINAAFAAGVAAFVETGRQLVEAKRALGHGAFMRMVETELRFSASTAERLMAIARHPVISDSAHAPILPPSWTVLYELARLPAGKVRKLIEQERIHPEMERSEAASLVLEAQPAPGIPADELRRANALFAKHPESQETSSFRQLAAMPPAPEPSPEAVALDRLAVINHSATRSRVGFSDAIRQLISLQKYGVFAEPEMARAVLASLRPDDIERLWAALRFIRDAMPSRKGGAS
jgi:hypothetical protein